MLKLLLKNRLNIILLGFTRDGPKRRAGRLIGTTISIIIFSLIIFYSIKLISLIYNTLDLEFADLILKIFLDYAFAMIFIFIIFSGIATSFYILYLSKDLELLLSFPISYRTVFTYKFIEILISNSYLFFITIFPFLIAYGITSKIPLAYYPIMLIVFISILSVPTGIGVLIGMISARYINPGKAKEMLAVIGGLFGITIFISSQITSRFVESKIPELKSMEIENIKQYILATFDKQFLRFLPSTWGSDAIYSFHNGNYASFNLNFILLIFTSTLLVLLCIALSQKLYYSGWSASGQVISRKKRPDDRIITSVNGFVAPIFSRINYILVKDFKILFRTPARLMQIFIPLAMFGFILYFLILKENNSNENINFFIGIDTISFLLFPLIIAGMVNLNVSENNIGREELNFWIIKTSPILTKKLIQIKIIFSSIISMLCGFIGIIIFYFLFKPGLLYLFLGLALLVLFSWGSSIIGTSVGAFFPVFKPSQSSKSNISFLGSLITIIFFFVYLLVFSSIVAGVLYIGVYFSWSNLFLFPIITLLELIITIVLYYVLTKLSSNKLNRLEWEY